MKRHIPHYFIRVCTIADTKSIFREILFWKIIPLTPPPPTIYAMDYPNLTVSNFMENSIGLKRVNRGAKIQLSKHRHVVHHHNSTNVKHVFCPRVILTLYSIMTPLKYHLFEYYRKWSICSFGANAPFFDKIFKSIQNST